MHKLKFSFLRFTSELFAHHTLNITQNLHNFYLHRWTHKLNFGFLIWIPFCKHKIILCLRFMACFKRKKWNKRRCNKNSSSIEKLCKFKLRKKEKVNKKCFVILQPLNFIVIFWRAFLMSCFFGNVSFNVFSRRFHRQAVNHALAGCNMGFLSRLMQAYMYCYRKKSSLQPINWTSDTLDRLKSAHSHPLASKIIFFKDEQKIQTIF